MTRQTNWAGNYEYQSKTIHRPKTVDELRELVRTHEKIRTLGSRHSFNTPEEKIKASVYYGGCMGAIVFVTFLTRWLVGIFKGF